MSDLYQNPCEDHIITDGEPADKLWLVKIALNYVKARGSQSLRAHWLEAQNDLIDFFAVNFRDRNQCAEYFELIANNIMQASAPVENVGDWFWWINYNWHWAGHRWYNYNMFSEKNPSQCNLYRRRYHGWFDSLAYQQWSFSAQGRSAKHFDSIKQYKWPAKSYINDVVPNPWYQEFKTKTASTTRYNGIDRFEPNPVAIMEDGSVLMHHDQQQVQQFVDRYLLI